LPREEVVASLCRFLDWRHPLPTDHWSSTPADGWYHDPVWTAIFPKYDLADREASLRRYWDDYHARSIEFSSRYPRNFRIFTTGALNSPTGVNELLTFAGIPDAEQNRETGLKVWDAGKLEPHYRRSLASNADLNAACHCAILVPSTPSVNSRCEAGLRELERRGYELRRGDETRSFDAQCNQLATTALTDGFLETMWIGPDIVFNPDDVERLRSHRVPIVSGIYPLFDRQLLDCHFLPSTKSVMFGPQAGLTEILRAGIRFLLVRRPVYMDLVREQGLPICNQATAAAFFPFFQPLVTPVNDGYQWLDSEFAFSEFARRTGYRIYADMAVRLYRQSSFLYGWEEAGRPAERFDNYHLTIS
jgi:hypothetical protein